MTERLIVTEFLDPDGSMVVSAQRTADRVLPILQRGQPVTLSFNGMRGVSSSFFNVLLRQLAPVTGIGDLMNRVSFEFDSSVQEMVFRRSLERLQSNGVESNSAE